MHIDPAIRAAVQASQAPAPSTTSQALELASLEGTVRLAPGVWLNTGEQLAGEAPRWGQHDLARGVEFRSHPYWLTTNAGQLFPVDNEAGLADALSQL